MSDEVADALALGGPPLSDLFDATPAAIAFHESGRLLEYVRADIFDAAYAAWRLGDAMAPSDARKLIASAEAVQSQREQNRREQEPTTTKGSEHGSVQ